MAVALDPEQALDYVALLSRDFGAAAILGGDGELLAGDPTLGAQIRAGQALENVLLVGSATHSIGVEIGRGALPGLLEHDLNVALKAMV